MSINYAIIGGDSRIVELSKLLANDGNLIYIYGLEKETKLQEIENIICCINMQQALNNAKIVIAPIPFSSNGIDINMPLSNIDISIKELLSNINDKIFIAGRN